MRTHLSCNVRAAQTQPGQARTGMSGWKQRATKRPTQLRTGFWPSKAPGRGGGRGIDGLRIDPACRLGNMVGKQAAWQRVGSSSQTANSEVDRAGMSPAVVDGGDTARSQTRLLPSRRHVPDWDGTMGSAEDNEDGAGGSRRLPVRPPTTCAYTHSSFTGPTHISATGHQPIGARQLSTHSLPSWQTEGRHQARRTTHLRNHHPYGSEPPGIAGDTRPLCWLSPSGHPGACAATYPLISSPVLQMAGDRRQRACCSRRRRGITPPPPRD